MATNAELFWRQIAERLDAIDRNWSWLARTTKISRTAIYRWRTASRRGGLPPRDARRAIEYVLEGAGANIVYQWIGPVTGPEMARQERQARQLGSRDLPRDIKQR